MTGSLAEPFKSGLLCWFLLGNGTGVETRWVGALAQLFRFGQSLHQAEGVVGRQLAVIAPLETGKVKWAHMGAGYCLDAMSTEMPSEAMLPEDSRKKS